MAKEKDKKKKDKAPVQTGPVKARQRFRTNRPDLVKKVRRIFRSSGPEAAKRWRAGEGHRRARLGDVSKTVGLSKVAVEELERYELRKERRRTRDADPQVRRSRALRRVNLLKDRSKQLTIEIEEREKLEKSLSELSEGEEVSLAVQNRMQNTRDLEVLYKERKGVRRSLAVAEQRLARTA